jgi:uncharacterized protein (TIGR00369 family)
VTAATAFRADIPFVNDLGVEFLAADAGRATIALQLQARHLNSWNVAHGGVIMTLLDVAMAVAGRSLDPGAGGGVTVEMKTSFVQPPHCERLRVPSLVDDGFLRGRGARRDRSTHREVDGHFQVCPPASGRPARRWPVTSGSAQPIEAPPSTAMY